MKAKELMIGDWVKVIEPDRYAGAQGTILSLTSREGGYYEINISDVNYGYLTTDVFNEDIEPIPLTAEILRKNGFEYGIFPEYKSNHIDTQTELKITVHSGTDTVFIAIDEPNFNLVNDCVLYIHELQHDLKRARIKKEVVL